MEKYASKAINFLLNHYKVYSVYSKVSSNVLIMARHNAPVSKNFFHGYCRKNFILSQECLFCVTPCSSKAPRDEEGKNYFHTSQADGHPAERYSSEMATELMRLTHMKIIW